MDLFPPRDERGRRILFTPGPLTTTRAVKAAMGIDIGSWDRDSIDLVAEIREKVLALAGGAPDLTVTPFQGTGSYAVEAVFGSAVPRGGEVLIPKNGRLRQRLG